MFGVRPFAFLDARLLAIGRGGALLAASLGRTMKPKKTILCVDDNDQLLSIRKVILETRGYRVLSCGSGAEAVKLFRENEVDLVLTDLVMPDVDGSELIEQIKAIAPHTPAILFSGKIKIYERDTRADVFLPKGMYAPAELLERIRIMLIKKRGPKRAVVPLPPARAVGAVMTAAS